MSWVGITTFDEIDREFRFVLLERASLRLTSVSGPGLPDEVIQYRSWDVAADVLCGPWRQRLAHGVTDKLDNAVDNLVAALVAAPALQLEWRSILLATLDRARVDVAMAPLFHRGALQAALHGALLVGDLVETGLSYGLAGLFDVSELQSRYFRKSSRPHSLV